MSVALRARQPPSKPLHGKFIYLFSNLRTNQVIYSLEKEIHTERQERVLLKQLTFYGKKTVPTKLRKDLWHPFATVTFPRPEDGLQAYKLLREYRLVRDHSWTFAPTSTDLARSQEVEALESQDKQSQDDGDFYGLAKIPTQYDNPIAHYTRWPDRKERALLLMDQRATSVADLSHILSRQLDPPSTLHRTFAVRYADKQRRKLWSKIQSLASTPASELKSLANEREELEKQAVVSGTTNQAQQTLAEKTKIKKRKKRVDEITVYLNRLRKAREAVTFASGGDVPESARVKWSKTLKYIVQQQVPDRPVIPSYDLEAAAARKEAHENRRPSNWPANTKFDGGALGPKMLTRRDRIALKGSKPEVDEREALGVPEGGVLIQWASLPDAQYAASWSEGIVHEAMEDRYVAKARKAFERMEAERELRLREGGEEEGSAGLRDRYAAPEPLEKGEGDGQKSGWLGTLNPMRLIRGSGGGGSAAAAAEARA